MKTPLFLFILVLMFSSLANAQDVYTRPTPKTPCLLDIKDSPALRGIKLGMKKPEVESLLGTKLDLKKGRTHLLVTDRSDSFLTRNLNFLLSGENDPIAKKVLDLHEGSIDPWVRGNKLSLVAQTSQLTGVFRPNPIQAKTEKFKDVRHISIDFFKEEVSHIQISYNTDVFNNVTDEEFYSEFLSLLNFPKDISTSTGVINCKGFSIHIWKVNTDILVFLDNSSIRSYLEREAVQTVVDNYQKLKKEKAAERGFKP